MDRKKEYCKLQKKSGLTNTHIALLFDVDPTTARRWHNQQGPIPRAVILCLKSIISGKPVEYSYG